MTEPAARAVVIAPLGVSGSLRVLLERLAGLGIEVDIVDELALAADVVAAHGDAPPVLLLDLRELAGDDGEDVRRATDAVRTTLAAIPPCAPVVITGDADAAMIVACLRAGAGDVIDIQLEGTAAARGVVERVFRRQCDRAGQLAQLTSLNGMVEDLLKDLIRTERRSIDLEEKLARSSREFPSPSDNRPAAILLVEPDRKLANLLVEKLEAAEITTFAYLTGDDAVRAATNLTMGKLPLFDLALVAAQLPDTDGLATIQRLRDKAHALPAFLMTATHDTELAERAADLGVVGFVHKPLSDLDDVVGRLAELARESLSRTREHAYLERIKARHERVLARYRSLPRGDS